MMKVYQPVCPDMKFRLVADLSPDAVEISEDSALSSDSASCVSDDEDVKVMVHQESSASNPQPAHYSCNGFSPSSASATPIPVTSELHHQHQVGSVTGAVCLMAELASASAQPLALSGVMGESNTHANGADCMGRHQEWTCSKSRSATHSISDSTHQKDSRVQYSGYAQDYDEEEVSATAHINGFSAASSPAPCSVQQPVCAYDKVCNSINQPHTQNGFEMDKDDVCVCDDDSDDDNASIEDISISHNVPMCPPSPAPFSPARTPPMTRRLGVKPGREVGVVSNKSTQGQRSEAVRSSGLYLDVHTKSLNKAQSPYTLACAITPSPLLEHTTMASTLSSTSNAGSGHNAASTATTSPHTSSNNGATQVTATQPLTAQPPDTTTDSQQGEASNSDAMNRSIYDEIQEALIKEVSGGSVQEDTPMAAAADTDPAQQYPFIHKHMGHLFDKKRLLIGYASSSSPVRQHRDVSTSPCRSVYSSSSRSRHVSAASTSASEAATSVDENIYVSKVERPASDDEEEEEVIGITLDDEPAGAASATVIYSQKRRRKNSDGDGSRRHSSSMATPYSDLEVTHRGMHRFIPRHADEVQIGIGDPIHVIKEFDDLWCEGVNLRSGERGIFPAMYANDLTFLEESEEEDEHWKFTMRFLGTVEVTSASGDIALCQAINKVAQQGRIKNACLCILEINQYGIRMIDKSKEGHESEKFSNFFALKNISFCGTHPNNNRYFAFITKHPREARFACHVFHSERSTHRARDALGKAFKRFYQEYMAFTHPTEDIWME
ncbi:uncharacterized protein LOC143283415 [Babylonia areolata]|uniref:uncharacterized protein LOC143283415 n=1 Tax=Babylonia areolata TaxID=304850 RepID=UPI003FD33225